MSPPSPDTSGIVYMKDSGHLFIADSEVDEMTIYKNVNMWELSLHGSTCSAPATRSSSPRQPTGVRATPLKTTRSCSL